MKNLKFRFFTNLKHLLIFVISAAMLWQSSYADVLGVHLSAESTKIAPETVYTKNVFEDSSVGKQTENYVEYRPNGIVLPAVANGWSAYGKRTVSQAAEILKQQGRNPAMGMNADFFSFQTGVPMSNTVIDGRIYTADSSWMPGIGFRKNGTAFTATFPINTEASLDDGSSFKIECINKYRQPYALYLFSSDFGDSTRSPGKGTDIILGSVSGSLRIGGKITAVVESISENDGSVTIPDGKLVLSVSASASDEIKSRLSGLSVGKTVTISTSASESGDLWESAVYAIGALGGKLITDGKLDYEDESAAPRSAVGIKANGNIIFYTIDGRQSGYSYGARKATVAKRLLELGCVEALSLDGGGSTSMGIAPVDSYSFDIVNSPSDGGLRSCANFLFLLKPFSNGIPYELQLKNDGIYMLSGASVSMEVAHALDSSYAYTDIPDGIVYSVVYDAETPDGSGRGSYIDENGYLTVRGNGNVYVAASSGDVFGEASALSVSTPNSIQLYSADNGYDINTLELEPGSVINLGAKSFWGGRELVSDNSCYRWTVVSDNASVGEVDSNGVFRASDSDGATGKLAVSAGICSVEIPVIINGGSSAGEDTVYPSIDGSVSGGKLNAAVKYDGIRKQNIRVSIDNTDVDFDFNPSDNKLTCALPDGYHRAAVIVTADSGISAMKFFDSGNIDLLENAFSDTSAHWAKGYISYLAERGIVKGNLEDNNVIRFNPDNNMTRVEFAIMMCNYLGVNPDDYADTELPFTDNGEIPWWAENQVKAIYKLGIMQGQLGQYGVTFNPTANINRMEFAISLNRLLPSGLASRRVTAADSAEIPFWAEKSMRTVCTQGIMNGYPDGTLRPLKSVTRAEAVKMLFNIFGI